MRILVTNDDGIYSPGLAALAKAASQFGEVRVVAPDVEQSSMGHAITATRPLSYKKSPVHFEGMEAYRVNGTPADCVALGTHRAGRNSVPGVTLITLLRPSRRWNDCLPTKSYAEYSRAYA